MPDPSPIGGTLRNLARGWGIADPDETAQLFVAWEQIVGPEVAAKCKPSSLKGGVLKVRTESSAWAWELKYLSAEVISRINKSLGKPVVTQVKPWVRPMVGENDAKHRRTRPAAMLQQKSISGKEAERAAEIASEVSDERVSEALRRAMLAAKRSQGRQ